MTSVSAPQMTLNFEPSLPDRFPTLRAYIAHRTPLLHKSAKVVAADMDMSPSLLSRKLNPTEGDTQRFNLDDLEGWIASTGEAAAVIEYLAAKFMDTPAARRERLLSSAERTIAEAAAVIAALKNAAS